MLIVRLQGDAERCQGVYYEFDIQSKPLGVGGMGKVYLGTRVAINTGTRIPVAIKALFEDATEGIVERARREASIRLKHENLVEMMGFVETFDTNSMGGCVKHYHVISEYIDGVMLSDLLCGMTKNQYGEELEAAQRLYMEYTNNRINTSIGIIKQVLSGVMALHDNGYIHRDIDPSNIMVTADGKVKLIDFGIAKKMKTLGSSDKNLTATGAFIGKAQYAAPELVTGDVPHQDATTDLYSIGILLYQLVVGKLPFVGPTHTVLDAQLHKNIPLKDIHNSDCKRIIARATRKSQPNRYQSAAAFRVDLDKVKIDNSVVKNKYAVGIAVFAACIVALLTWKLWNPVDDPVDDPGDVVIIVKDTVESYNGSLYGIDDSVAHSINVDATDFNKVIEIAKCYYQTRESSLSEIEKEKGRNVLKTQYGKDLLSNANQTNEYSNVKVAFVLFEVTKEAAKKSEKKGIVDECNENLKKIEKINGIVRCK